MSVNFPLGLRHDVAFGVGRIVHIIDRAFVPELPDVQLFSYYILILLRRHEIRPSQPNEDEISLHK